MADNRDGLQGASVTLISKALVWRQQAQKPFTRAEAELAGAVDSYLVEIGKYTGYDVSARFRP